MLKKRLLIAASILLLFFATFVIAAIKQAKELHRDPTVLMHKYYQVKYTNPSAAKKILLIILKQEPNYLPAVREYRLWLPTTPVRQELLSYLPYYQDQAQTHAKTQLQANSIKKAQNNHAFIKHAFVRPSNKIHMLKEAGFLAIAQGHPILALNYFSKAYEVHPEPSTAMQLGYLYEQLNDRKTAYHYFTLATQSQDKSLSLSAENALTTLVGQQTKILPRAYFSEVYLNPFSQTRFGLTVVPFIWRLGLEQENRLRTKEYVFVRRTQDNRSANFGELSAIYEDNVQIEGVGIQITPLRNIPLIGFVEGGTAYDLVYLNRSRWRADLRAGLMYYRDFGTPPGYFDKLKVGHAYYSDWYGDITYFTRYNNNVIGLIRTHQGIRLLQYHSSMVNLYVTGRVIADTKREFYNNIAEVGPGISFVPSNRFHLQLRFEQVNGMYLPAGRFVNPYGKYYTNNVVQLLFYMKF